MKEIWIKIEGYNYSISNKGNVRNDTTLCLLKPQKNLNTDHSRIFLYKKGIKRKRFLIHRLVAIAFIPNPNNYPIVNHLDSNPNNNNVLNLQWTTQSGNCIHARDTGRLSPPIGEKNGMSILNEEKAIRVIMLWNKGLTQLEIADIMNVSRSCICGITQKRKWKHLSNLIIRK